MKELLIKTEFFNIVDEICENSEIEVTYYPSKDLISSVEEFKAVFKEDGLIEFKLAVNNSIVVYNDKSVKLTKLKEEVL